LGLNDDDDDDDGVAAAAAAAEAFLISFSPFSIYRFSHQLIQLLLLLPLLCCAASSTLMKGREKERSERASENSHN